MVRCGESCCRIEEQQAVEPPSDLNILVIYQGHVNSAGVEVGTERTQTIHC